jgi:uncharacterized protein (DUF1697 family)
MQYVALLRGINVGGKNIIPMAALARCFEALKLANVKTYIASGNVVFETASKDARKLEVMIEKALTKTFGYDATVVVKSANEMRAIVDGLPKDWRKASAAMRYYVVFLRHGIDKKTIVDELETNPKAETLVYVPGALLWATKRSEQAKSKVARKLSSKAIYPQVTIRNVNTAQKLAELVGA